eukprot:gene21559-27914_t
MYAGCVFGASIGGSVCDYFGRRITVFIVSIVFIIGALIQALAPTVSILYIGRFIIGIGVAISAIVDVTYLNEISPLEYRGAVVSTNEFMITVGFLLAFLTDYGFENVNQGWRYMFGFPGVLSIIWSVLMYSMPESPRWLLVKGRVDEATENFSGNAGVLAYAPEFFRYAGYGGNSSSLATIILGRRIMLLTGVLGMTIALIVLSVLLMNTRVSDDDNNSSTLSPGMSGLVLFFVCVYIGSYGIGYGPVTWLICSEMFSDEIRGRTLGFATVANWLSTLIVVGSFLSSANAIGLSYTLAIYAIICGFAFSFAYILVPETALREPLIVVKYAINITIYSL